MEINTKLMSLKIQQNGPVICELWKILISNTQR